VRRFGRGWPTLVFCLLATAVFVLPAAAQEEEQRGIVLGSLKLYPSVNFDAQYQSNIYRDYHNEEEDIILTFWPALKAFLPIQRFTLLLDGQFTLTRYLDNARDDNTTFSLGGSLGANFPGGLEFQVADLWRRQYLPTEAEFDIAEYFDANQFYVEVAYRFGDRIRLALEYTAIDFTYEESDDLDREEDIWALTLFYRVRPKVSVFLEGGYSELEYHRRPYYIKDNENLQFRGGVRWDFTAKSSGEFRLGMHWKDYQTGISKDERNVVATARLDHAFTDRTILGLELRRQTVESDYYISHPEDMGNPHYLSTRLGATLRQRFGWRVTGEVGVYYREDVYPNVSHEHELNQTAKRDETALGFHLAGEMGFLNHFTLRLSFGQENRNSNLDAYDYRQRTLSLGLKAFF
jgi:hypothetical protein